MATYVTKKDYYKFSGIDLSIELKKSNIDNPTKAVDIFLNKVENFCIDHLKFKYFLQDENIDADAMKQGILHQIDYMRVNGDLINYNPTNLPLLSKTAYMAFKMGGMANVSIDKSKGVYDPWL